MPSLPPGKTCASSLGYGFQDEDANESRLESMELHDLASRLEQSRTEMHDEETIQLYMNFLCKTMVLLISFLPGSLWRIEQKLAHSMKETTNFLQNYGIIKLQDHGNNDKDVTTVAFFKRDTPVLEVTSTLASLSIIAERVLAT